VIAANYSRPRWTRWVVTGTLVSYAVAWVVGVPALVPVLNTLPAFPFLVVALRRGQLGRAVAMMSAWAATMGVAATALSYLDPAGTGRLFIHADAYRHEMFLWVQTGIGAESNPAQFGPSHALHAAVFCALSWVSGSVLSMPMGAVLMNYMGHFVGALASTSRHPLPTVILGWLPWSLVRIASFIVLGVVLGGPVLSRVGGFQYRLGAHRRLLLLALAGLLVDAAVKAALAPAWAVMLRRIVGW